MSERRYVVQQLLKIGIALALLATFWGMGVWYGDHRTQRWYAAHERTGFLVYKGGKLDRIEATTNHATMLANEDWRAITIPAPNQLLCCNLNYNPPAPQVQK